MVRSLVRDTSIDRVIGVDVVPPRRPLLGADFVRADIRSPVIGRVLSTHEVDTVVHMGVIATTHQAGGRTAMKDINVIGTMQLLAACQKSESVNRLVVKSTSSVYGAGPRDPALFTEDMSPKHPPTSGWAKDSVEVEGYVRGFARRRPDVAVTIMRLANVIGPRVETAMTAYFTLPVIPTVMGFDARLQFIHEDDSISALHRAVGSPVTGVFNIAGRGCSPCPRQCVGPAGRPCRCRVPCSAWSVARWLPHDSWTSPPSRCASSPMDEPSTPSVLVAKLAFTAKRTTSEAFDDFLAGHGLGPTLITSVVDGAAGCRPDRDVSRCIPCLTRA